jgi:hypothetical protein
MPQMQDSWARRSARPCPRCFPTQQRQADADDPTSHSGGSALIYTAERSTSVQIRAFISDSGALVLQGQDIGEAPESVSAATTTNIWFRSAVNTCPPCGPN